MMKKNPFRKGTWSYDFYKEGYDGYKDINPYSIENEDGHKNEFAEEQWNDDQDERLKEENGN